MSDTATPAAPAAPATPPAPETPKAPAASAAPPPKVERSSPSGTPPPAAPATPKKWKLGEREVSEEELIARAEKARLDEEGEHQGRHEVAKARQLLRALKEGRLAEVLDPAARRAMALEEAKRWKQEEEEKALPPEEKERRALRRELEAYKAREKEREEAEHKTKEAALDDEERERSVQEVRAALKATGLPNTPFNARRVASKMAANLRAGKNYPINVVALQVRREIQAEREQEISALSPKDFARLTPKVLEHLNALDDDELLDKLGPLGERLRQRNLKKLQMTPAQPAATRPAPVDVLDDGKPPETPEDWERLFKRRTQGR